jgi:hypothetical protein
VIVERMCATSTVIAVEHVTTKAWLNKNKPQIYAD